MSAGVLSYLRHLLPSADAALADGELLRRFVAARDQGAFTELLRRHGPLVWGVCRRVLGEAAAVEDAFQATFLELSRRAAALGRDGSLAGWLHTVAARVARRARLADERRRRRDRAHLPPVPAYADHLTWCEVRQLLDAEIARLPGPYRPPLILCYLENRSQAEAACVLGLAPAVLRGRLERGRQKLRRRLEARGLPLAAGLLLTRAGPAPAALREATLRTACAALAGGPVPPAVAALAAGGTPLARVKRVIAAVLVALAAAGVGDAGRRNRPGAAPSPGPPSAAARGPADGLGDPLPEGGLLRLGTVRFCHPGGANAVVVSPDGKTLATVGAGTVRVWDAATGKPGPVLPWPGAFYGAGQNELAFSPDGRRLFFPDKGGVTARDLVAGRTQVVWPASPETRVHAVHPSPDGRLLAVATSEGVRVLELASGRVLWRTQNGPDAGRPKDDRLLFHGPYSLALFAPDGKAVAVNASDDPRALRLLDPATGEVRRRVALGDRLVRLAFSPDGRQVAATERDNAVRVYDAATGRRLHSWVVRLTNPYENFTAALAFSPDGATLAAGATDHLVHLWDLRARAGRPARPHLVRLGPRLCPGRALAVLGRRGGVRPPLGHRHLAGEARRGGPGDRDGRPLAGRPRPGL
jgi:RNA polymerase sigma factor (sigma-70 family)